MTGGLYNNVRLNHVTSYVLYLNHHKFLEKKIIQYTLSELKSRHIIKNVSERLFFRSEDTDRTPPEQILWWKVYHQGFGVSLWVSFFFFK